jgi:hypothetical protein
VINHVKVTPARPLSDFGKVILHEDDCSHFLSCCVGKTEFKKPDGTVIRGGGLDIGTSKHIPPPGYGHDNPPYLLGVLQAHGARVAKEYLDMKAPGLRHSLIWLLKPGDVLVYASADKNTSTWPSTLTC